jgi:hypothetical protein
MNKPKSKALDRDLSLVQQLSHPVIPRYQERPQNGGAKGGRAALNLQVE